MLIEVIALVMAQPVALLAVALVTGSATVTVGEYLYALQFVVPLTVTAGLWIASYPLVRFFENGGSFRYTRYGIPNKRVVNFADVTTIRFSGGIIGLDNRPRPFFEFLLRSGESFWIPLSIYNKKTIKAIVDALESRGLVVST